MSELHTTFNLLKQAGACGQKPGSGKGYDKLATAIGGVTKYGKNTIIPLSRIVETNGLADALWCLGATLPEEEANRDKLARLFACDCAERRLPLFEHACPGDKRPRQAIEAARQFVAGAISKADLGAAGAAAWAAAEPAAWAAAWAAAGAAAEAAAEAAAWAAAWAGEQLWQQERFLAYLNEAEKRSA